MPQKSDFLSQFAVMYSYLFANSIIDFYFTFTVFLLQVV